MTTKERNRKNHAKVKLDIIGAYGGKCTCCGETTPEFLGIDHINGGGTKHRKEVGTGYSFYLWLRRQGYPKDEFQLHCHNCNMAKHCYGLCPHQISKE